MQFDYWTYLYENWFVFFGVMLTIITIMTLIIVRVVIMRIQDKVLYFQKNSIDEYKAKLEKSVIHFGKHRAKKVKDAYMMKRGFRLVRMYVIDWKKKESVDLRDIKPISDDDKLMWETVIESEAITQSVRGLFETAKMIIIYLCAGAFGGFLISQLLFAFTGG